MKKIAITAAALAATLWGGGGYMFPDDDSQYNLRYQPAPQGGYDEQMPGVPAVGEGEQDAHGKQNWRYTHGAQNIHLTVTPTPTPPPPPPPPPPPGGGGGGGSGSGGTAKISAWGWYPTRTKTQRSDRIVTLYNFQFHLTESGGHIGGGSNVYARLDACPLGNQGVLLAENVWNNACGGKIIYTTVWKGGLDSYRKFWFKYVPN